jgi:hypothetical protein
LASKTTQSPNGASEGKKATLTPAIIVRSENGKIKAYWGFKKTNCGNPVYNPKDSITENFLLIADSKQILFTK